MEAYFLSLNKEGWVPVDNPKPIYKDKYKVGISGFKFYCRIKVDLTVYCVKLPK